MAADGPRRMHKPPFLEVIERETFDTTYVAWVTSGGYRDVAVRHAAQLKEQATGCPTE